MKVAFNPDIFMGKLLTWIVKTDQPFSAVDNAHFEDLVEYLKKDVTVNSRRTIMRRLDELYIQVEENLKKKLQSFKSKYSITCDVWTSKNQLSFFGFTIHYIDDNWVMQQHLIAFKYLEDEHDGLSLSKAMLGVLENLGVLDRLLGVTVDNAANNSTMLAAVETYMLQKHPDAGFSVNWNKVECMAHVLNLGAKEILKRFKQPVEAEYYTAESGCDTMVTSLSRLAFLVRKIRRSPKLRRLMKGICDIKNVEYLVPIIDVSTRWNSTYDMVTRAIDYKEIISDTFYAFKDNSLISLLLNEAEWKSLDQLIEVLRPLKEATLLTSQNSESLCVFNVLPLYYYCTETLAESLTKFSPEDDIYIGIEAAIEKLNYYYDNVSPLVGIAMILEPTLKKQYLSNCLCWKEEWVDAVLEQFNQAFSYYKGVVKE
jgi:hypothetical protein